MSALLLRELRRQVPIAGALVGLAAILAACLLAYPEARASAPECLRFAILIAAGSCAILGVATVAPDTSSGAIAFLARMPLAHGRAVAAKLGVAAALAVFVFVADVALARLAVAHSWSQIDLGAATALSLLGFGAGVVASVVAARTMPALLLAPIVAVVVALVAVAGPFLAIHVHLETAPDATLGVLGAFLGLALLGGASAAYVLGERHRPSMRPGTIALATVAPILVVGLGGTCTAHALTVERAVAELPARVAIEAPGGARVALLTWGLAWFGFDSRVAILDRGTGTVWTVPVTQPDAPVFSEDGKRFLVTSERDEWFVGDCESRTVRPLVHGRDESPTLVCTPQSRQDGVSFSWSWAESGPGSWPHSLAIIGLPSAPRAMSRSGRRALLREDASLIVHDAATGARAALDLSGLEETLSPSALLAVRTSWSPSEEKLALRFDAFMAFFDARTGRRLGRAPHGPDRTARSPGRDAPAWSPDETLAAHDGTLVPLVEGATAPRRAPVLAFVSSTSYVALDQPVAILPLR